MVLQAGERNEESKKKDPAEIGSAARTLAGLYGDRLRILVDASDNALSEKKTKRERFVVVGPASRIVLESMPNLKALLEALKAEGLADVVWECVGGVPVDYVDLNEQWMNGGKLEAVVERFLKDRLSSAILNVQQSPPPLQEIYALFRTQDKVPSSVFKGELKRASPDKVLRLVQPDNVLIPADAATAVALRFPEIMGNNAPGLQKLKELLCTNPPSASA